MSDQTCAHCFNPIESLVTSPQFPGLNFCCHGCHTVYGMIQDCGLSEYYQLKAQSESLGQPANVANEKYNFLDQPEFLQKYAVKTEHGLSLKFYLQGVHCAACLWIIEKIPQLHPQVVSCKLDMSKSIATIVVAESGQFAPALRSLNGFGYTPYPVLGNTSSDPIRLKEDRSMLLKTAVAFACSGNIMLLAISSYAGASGDLLKQFHWYSFLLSLPVFFYCAIPFYKSAYYALKGKNISIDVPIVLSIVMGFILSLFSMFSGGDLVYFDTLTMLVFFLLFTRFILRLSYHRSLDTGEMAELFASKVVQRLDVKSGEYTDTFARFLRPSDLIKVSTHQMVPVDCELISENAHIDSSLLTGESVPITIAQGEFVSSGSVNVGDELQLRVMQSFEQSRLGEILGQVEAGWNTKSPIIDLADRAARNFVYVVFILSTITFIATWLTSGQINEALVRTLALIIVTCPCALALTTPLVLSMALTKLAKAGMMVKDEQTIEKLSSAKTIFLDKTGTLTLGKFKINSAHYYSDMPVQMVDSLAVALENKSSHPIARSLVDNLKPKLGSNLSEIELTQFSEISGKGVSAWAHNHQYRIEGLESPNGIKRIGLYQDDQLLAHYDLNDRVRKESKQLIKSLKQMGLKIVLLSGDNQFIVESLARNLEIDQFHSELTPEDKAQILENHPNAIMVGDGANDAIAFSKAHVGVAVKGSMEISLRACEVFLTREGLTPVYQLLRSSKKVMNQIRINFILSLGYNFIACALAMSGHISPLYAAIIMPCSSLTVLIMTLIFGQKLGKFLNSSKHDLDHNKPASALLCLNPAKG